MNSLYYECHVTVDPVKDKLDLFTEICKLDGFKPAKLLMQKDKELIPSDLDSFCTAHDKYFLNLRESMIRLVKALKHNGFVVRRYKIESVVLDSRVCDREMLLK